MTPRLEAIRREYDDYVGNTDPFVGIDTPEEGEATERLTREVIVYTAEETTLGEVLRTAQALEKAGFEARVKFTRLDGGDEHRPHNPIWGIAIGIREKAA